MLLGNESNICMSFSGGLLPEADDLMTARCHRNAVDLFFYFGPEKCPVWTSKTCISCYFILGIMALLCFSSKLLGNKHYCLGWLSKLFLRKRDRIQTVMLFFQSFEKEEKLLFAIF